MDYEHMDYEHIPNTDYIIRTLTIFYKIVFVNLQRTTVYL